MIPEELKKELMSRPEFYVGLSRGKLSKDDSAFAGKERWVIGYPLWRQVVTDPYPYSPTFGSTVCHRIIWELDFKESGEMYTKKWYHVLSETLSPFSGFFDCNGEPIFFGDIIQICKRTEGKPDEDVSSPALVLYDRRQKSSLVEYFYCNEQWVNAIPFYDFPGFYFKVVGNVWDNGEEMKEWFGEDNAKALAGKYYV